METVGSQTHTKNIQVVDSFWVSAGPFFDTDLVFSPLYNDRGEISPLNLKIFDVEGELCNEVELTPSKRGVESFAIESLMERCRLESGLKQAHLQVTHDGSYLVQTRLYGNDTLSMMKPAIICGGNKKLALPVTMWGERHTLLALMNTQDSSVTVRSRLFLGNRSPEAVWTVPAHAVKLINLKLDYEQLLGGKNDIAPSVGYVRLQTRSTHEQVAIQIVEWIGGTPSLPQTVSVIC